MTQARQNREKDDDHVKRRRRRPDLEDALEEQIDLTAEIALHSASRDPDQRARPGHDQRKQHRSAVNNYDLFLRI